MLMNSIFRKLIVIIALRKIKRELKKIIYQHFDYIVSEWNNFKETGNG